MIDDKTLIFIDGENITLRYEEMLKQGRKPSVGNVHIPGCFIWNQNILNDQYWSIKRLSYYTSVCGDDAFVREIRAKIANTVYISDPHPDGRVEFTSQMIPFVRKKPSKSKKESVCDIAIAVDVMRACYRDHAEGVWIFSGDGDFLQLIAEAVHSGKRVYQSALSSGLNEELRYVVDEFILLDKYLFEDIDDDVAIDGTQNT